MKVRYFQPRFIAALLRNIGLKLRFGAKLKMNIATVFIERGAEVRISGNGSITFEAGRRIYVSRGSVLHASSGALFIGEGVFFNVNCMAVAHNKIVIGAACMFGPGVCIFDSDHQFSSMDRPFFEQGYSVGAVELGENVWLGAYTVIARGSQIGRSSVVGAHSFVNGKLPEGTLSVGSPAKPVRAIGTVPMQSSEDID